MGEDSVNGWDLKTKVLFVNRSLVLDPANPEFLGGALARWIYAPLADVYFMLPYSDIPLGLTNIISPIIYLSFTSVLIGIFLRKTNIIFSMLAGYVFTSLPLVFIHAFESYLNLPSTYFIFCFSFYVSDQILNLYSKPNHSLIYPMVVFAFMASVVRSENYYFLPLIFGAQIFYYLFGCTTQKSQKVMTVLRSFVLLVPIFVVTITNNYFASLHQGSLGDISRFSINMLMDIPKHIASDGVLEAPFEQLMLHPDYNILFAVFVGTLIIVCVRPSKYRELFTMFSVAFLLLAVIVFALYSSPLIGLMTHYGVRYMMLVVPFFVYITLMVIFLFFEGGKEYQHDASRGVSSV